MYRALLCLPGAAIPNPSHVTPAPRGGLLEIGAVLMTRKESAPPAGAAHI